MHPHSNAAERPPGRRWLPAGLLPTVLVVLAIVGGLEAVTRCVLAPASNDFRSFSTYLGKAAALDASPGLRIAVVGNSTARAGVDCDVLGKLMTTALGRPVMASLFVADSAEVTTWHFMLSRFFWQPRLRPDVVVLLYYGDGLFDSREPEIGRLAQFFTTPADIPRLFRDYLPRAGQRLDYLASAYWMTYAAKDRLRERALKVLVPNYAEYSRRLNAWQYAHRVPAQSRPSFEKLGRLLADARANGSKVVVVALPTAPSWQYDVPNALVATVEEAGMTFMDDRFIPSLPPDLFPDGLHLADEGKAIYTSLLAAELSQLFSPETGSQRSDAE